MKTSRNALLTAALMLPLLTWGASSVQANIIRFDLVGNSDQLNQASAFTWNDPTASVTLDFLDQPSTPDTITLAGATAADPVYAQQIIVRNKSAFTWLGFDLSLSGTAGGIPNNITFDNPASATATNLAGTLPVFTTQFFTSPNEIIFTGGSLAPGGIVVFHTNVNVPVSNNDFTFTFGEQPLTSIPAPEPASLSLLGLGLALLTRRRK